MKVLLFALLFVGCESEPYTIKHIEETRSAYYLLGRAAGIHAVFQLNIRQIETGQKYTMNDVNALADSVAGFNP